MTNYCVLCFFTRIGRAELSDWDKCACPDRADLLVVDGEAGDWRAREFLASRAACEWARTRIAGVTRASEHTVKELGSGRYEVGIIATSHKHYLVYDQYAKKERRQYADITLHCDAAGRNFVVHSVLNLGDALLTEKYIKQQMQ